MGFYQYLSSKWKKPKEGLGSAWRSHLIAWRREPATSRIERPTRLDRAHALGYRAKQGVFVVRQRVSSGGHKRPDFDGGRHSKHFRTRMILAKNYRLIAEERAGKAFPNCEVLNSYEVGADSKHYWFEVILADRSHPAVLADSRLSWVANPAQLGRVYRGRTSAGRKMRGLRHKGKGTEHMRPSRDR
jgi:large subunit ribosomal protein L15e